MTHNSDKQDNLQSII